MTYRCYVYMVVEVASIIAFKLGDLPFNTMAFVGDVIWKNLSDDERDRLNRRTM